MNMKTYCKVLLSLPWLLLLMFLILYSCDTRASIELSPEREARLLFLIDRVSWALLAKYELPPVIRDEED